MKMKKLDIRPIINGMRDVIANHKLENEGEYARWIWQNEAGTRDLGVNEYGCADAMNVLYTIGDFACSPEVREARIKVLQSLQNKETGLFYESTHHKIHTTAHCAAALDLFDAKPLYPLYELHRYLEKDALYRLLNELDWFYNPWPESHKGAGVYAALVNAGEATPEFCENYFAWFRENADPVTGFWKKGYVENAPFDSKHPMDRQGPMFTYMAGGFHYLFNHEHAKMPLMYPDKMIDSCIKMYDEGALPEYFGKRAGFIEIDWVYCLTRAMRQTPHRFEEGKVKLADFAEKYVANINAMDFKTDDSFNDLHMLFGMVCALAELQSALPGTIITEKPLRLVLDRRPFI